MVHDFLVTQNHTAFPVLPLTGDIGRAKRGLPAFAWEPEKGAFVGLMARNAGVDTVRWIEVDPVCTRSTPRMPTKRTAICMST